MTAICRKIKGTVCCLNENPDYLFSVKPAAANKMREANLGTPCGGNIENKKNCQNGFIISFSVNPAAATQDARSESWYPTYVKRNIVTPYAQQRILVPLKNSLGEADSWLAPHKGSAATGVVCPYHLLISFGDADNHQLIAVLSLTKSAQTRLQQKRPPKATLY